MFKNNKSLKPIAHINMLETSPRMLMQWACEEMKTMFGQQTTEN